MSDDNTHTQKQWRESVSVSLTNDDGKWGVEGGYKLFQVCLIRFRGGPRGGLC